MLVRSYIWSSSCDLLPWKDVILAAEDHNVVLVSPLYFYALITDRRWRANIAQLSRCCLEAVDRCREAISNADQEDPDERDPGATRLVHPKASPCQSPRRRLF